VLEANEAFYRAFASHDAAAMERVLGPRREHVCGVIRLCKPRRGEGEEVAVIDRNRIREGMVVHSADGRKLGRVLDRGEATFVIEKGFYFTTDYVAHYDDVMDVSGDEVRLAQPESALPHGERALKREGGLGESISYGGSVETSPMTPWGRAEEEEEEARQRSVREQEDERRSTYDLSGADTLPHCWGDEGGGGLL
jgi:hypothetical protein